MLVSKSLKRKFWKSNLSRFTKELNIVKTWHFVNRWKSIWSGKKHGGAEVITFVTEIIKRYSHKLFFFPPFLHVKKETLDEGLINENCFAKICRKKVHGILHQSELSSFPVPFLAHSGDATPFRIQVDFKMASDSNECFVKYAFSKLTDSGNSIEIFPL